MHRLASWGVTKQGAPPHKCGHMPTGLCCGIHLSKMLHIVLGKVVGQSGMKKESRELANVNKDTAGLSCISDLNYLFTLLLTQDTSILLCVCIFVLLLT